MKTCWYRAVTGEMPDKDECTTQMAYGGCEMCSYHLEEPPEPDDKNAEDELPEWEDCEHDR